MIRPFTCLCLAAAFGSGLYLYSEKHQAEMLDKKIGAVVRDTEAAHARIAELQTEWATLNDPGRLQEISSKYLPQLQPLAPAQFVQLSDLPARLPPPEAAKPAPVTDEDSQAPVPVAGDPVPPQADMPPPDPAPPALPKPTRPSVKLAAKNDTKAHHVTLAERESLHTGALARGTMLPLAAPQPMHASIMTAMARPLPRARPATVSAVPAYAAPTYIGSAIGASYNGSRSALPPPVPLGAGEQ